MTGPASGGHYEIRVRGILDDRWSGWFLGLQVEARTDDTVLFGDLPDQAALHGVLNRIRDLGLVLVSVSSVERPERRTAPDR